MSGEDPFGLKDRDATTIVVRGPATPPRSPDPSDGDALAEAPRAASGPLLAKAESLLTLATVLRTADAPGDPGGLAAELRGALETYGDAIARDADPATVTDARLVVAAFLDDVLINATPWGLSTLGPGQRFAALLHGDIDAGRSFFQVLERAERAPQRNRDLLELIHACLALGFKGVYRTAPPPGPGLEERTRELYRLLARDAGEEAGLSPHWRGREIPIRAEGRRVPLFVPPVAALVVLAALFVALSYRLGGQSEQVAALLPPAGPVTIQRVTLTPPPPLPEPDLPPEPAFVEIDAFLADEQAAGLVEVVDYGDRYTVRLLGGALFASGSDVLKETFRPVVAKIAAGLADRPGPFTVVGHTDSVPMRPTERFASNMELSEGRAAAVARLLIEAMGRSGDVEVEGAGATRPIADNGSAEGRARNRRVEIVVPRVEGERDA
jgi:type VI secretion system protein ImpK